MLQQTSNTLLSDTIPLRSSALISSSLNNGFLKELENTFSIEAQILTTTSDTSIIVTSNSQDNIDKAKEAIEILDKQVSNAQELSTTQYKRVFTRVKRGKDILVSYPESVGKKNPKFTEEPKVVCWKGFPPAKSKLEKISKAFGLTIEKQDDGFVDIHLAEAVSKEKHEQKLQRLNAALDVLQIVIEDRSLNTKNIEEIVREKIRKSPQLSQKFARAKRKTDSPKQKAIKANSPAKSPHLYIRRLDDPEQSVASLPISDITVPQDPFLACFKKEFRVETELRPGKDDLDIFIGARSEGANPSRAIAVLVNFLERKLPQTEEEFYRQIDPLTGMRQKYQNDHEVAVNRISLSNIPSSVLSGYTQVFGTEILPDNQKYYIFGDTKTEINRTALVLEELQKQFAQNEYDANLKEAERLLEQRSNFFKGLLHKMNAEKEKNNRAIKAQKGRITTLEAKINPKPKDKKAKKETAPKIETAKTIEKAKRDIETAKTRLANAENELKQTEAKIETITPYCEATATILGRFQNIAKEKLFSKQDPNNVKELPKIIDAVLAQQNAEKVSEAIEGTFGSLMNAINEQTKLKAKKSDKLTDIEKEKISYDYDALKLRLVDDQEKVKDLLEQIKTETDSDQIIGTYEELILIYSDLNAFLQKNDVGVRLKKYQTYKPRPQKGLLKYENKNNLIMRAKRAHPALPTDPDEQPRKKKTTNNQKPENDRNKAEAETVRTKLAIQAFKKKIKTPTPILYHSELGVDLSELALFLSEDKSQAVATTIFESELGIWLEPEYVERADAWGLKIYESSKLSEMHKGVRNSVLHDLSLLASSSNTKSLTSSYTHDIIESKFIELRQKNGFNEKSHGFFVHPEVHNFFTTQNRAENLSVFEEKLGVRLKLGVTSQGHKGFHVHLSENTQDPDLETITNIGYVLEVIEERLNRMKTSRKIKAPSNEEIRGWLNNPKGAHNGIKASSSAKSGFEVASNTPTQTSKPKASNDNSNIVIPELSDSHAETIKQLPEPKPFVPLRRASLTSDEKSSQEKLWTSFENNVVTFALGPAATGKTYTSIRYLVGLLKDGHVNRIIIGRPAVEAGERLGFLPGDAKDKVDPYMQPIYDAFHEILGQGDMHEGEKFLNDLVKKKIVEISPLAFMRGRTFKKSGVYIDEAQNASYMQLKTIMTRLGQESTMIFGGDESQDDLREFGAVSGLLPISNLFSTTKGFGIVHMDPEDATARHELLTSMVRKFNAHEESSGSLTLGGLTFEEFVEYRNVIQDSQNNRDDLNLRLSAGIAQKIIDDATRKASNAERKAFIEALTPQEEKREISRLPKKPKGHRPKPT